MRGEPAIELEIRLEEEVFVSALLVD